MLNELLAPRSIAVIGASRTPGKVGNAILSNLIQAGFQGQLVPVNPSAGEILGRPCYADISAWKEGPLDLAIIVVPIAAVHEAVARAVSRGAQAVVVITAGFREVGGEGKRQEETLARFCRERGVRLMGPNCLGLINTHHHLNASFAAQMPAPGAISIISQSGALCTAILDWAEQHHLGLAKLISIGNKADLSEVDFMAALARDDQTRVIVGYLESIASGDEFVRMAEATAAAKPVVILKAGTTGAGVRAASSHTGSLAGTDIAYQAAFKRSGIIRADSFESLFDHAKAFAMQPLPAGNRVAIVTNAGGPGIMAADAIEEADLRMAALDTGTAESLKASLPAAASVANPIDILGDADATRYARALEAALGDGGVDAVLVILTPQAMTQPSETARAVVAAARKASKPVLTCFMGGTRVQAARDALTQASVPDYTAPRRAVAPLAAMCHYAAWRRRPTRVVTRFPVNRRRVERVLARQQRERTAQVNEVRAKEILRAYDFAVPEGLLATSVEEAVDAANRIGYPVAMKIVSPDVVHKSDLGGVWLNLSRPDKVRDAFELMMLRIPRQVPGARIDGVYIEKMAPRGREVILGMTRDPQFGPMLMFGLGGIFVEVMKDVSFHLAPLTAEEAVQMLTATRSYALLRGVRGQAGVDVTAIASGLQRISQLATDFPQIAELDINPLIVGEAGTPPIAADARITIAMGAKPR
jgi:acetyltransferase